MRAIVWSLLPEKGKKMDELIAMGIYKEKEVVAIWDTGEEYRAEVYCLSYDFENDMPYFNEQRPLFFSKDLSLEEAGSRALEESLEYIRDKGVKEQDFEFGVSDSVKRGPFESYDDLETTLSEMVPN